MTAKEQLESRGGRFTSIKTKDARGNVKSYCAQVKTVTDKSVRFRDVNAGVDRTIPLKNVVVQ